MTESGLARLLEGCRQGGIEWALVVPASGLAGVYAHFERRHRCLYATREEEAVAIATGLSLGGEAALVLMQQAGVGNALNGVLSLADAYGVYFPILVFDRSADDPNPVQRVSSAGTAAALAGLGCARVDWEDPDAVASFLAGLARRERWIVSPLCGRE